MKRYSVKQFTLAMRSLAQVPSKVSGPYAARLRKELQLQFDKGVDPYGRAWSPLKPATLAKGRFPPPLTDTRKGRKGVTALPMKGAGVRLQSTVGYMQRHQEGTENMAARPFFPVRVLPKQWAKIYDEELQKVLDKEIG